MGDAPEVKATVSESSAVQLAGDAPLANASTTTSDAAAAQPLDAASGAFSAESLTDSLGSALVVAGVMVLIFVLLRRIRQARTKSSAVQEPAKERIDRLQAGARTASDVHALAARAQESVQEIVTRLENRAVRLEALLDKADARIAALERLAEDANGPTEPVRALPDLDGAARAPSNPEPPTMDPLHQRVHALADEGLSAVDIARRVDRPTGQVELILALRRA